MSTNATPSQPWLSVLLPVFNGAGTLQATLDALEPQSEGIEVIAVDQGSKDQSHSLLDQYAARFNIRIINAPDNKNWVQNTNLALAHARAPHATLLHQDDVWMAGRATLLKSMLSRNPDAVVWIHAAHYISSNGKIIGRFAPPFGNQSRVLPSQEALAHLLVQNTIALPAAMFPTQLALDIGGLDEALWYTADWDFWLKLCAAGPVAWSPQAKAGFRLHGSAQTLAGSRDTDGFKQQLSAPLERHLALLNHARQPSVGKLARASNAANHWLAAAYHKERPPLTPLLGQILKLGPALWWPFLRDTRIVQRVLPRLSQLK